MEKEVKNLELGMEEEVRVVAPELYTILCTILEGTERIEDFALLF